MLDGKIERRAAIVLGAGGTHNLRERQRVRALVEALKGQRGTQEHNLGEETVAAFVTVGKSDRDFTLGEAVAALAARGVTDVVIVPYLLEWPYPEQYDVHDQLQDLAREHPQVRLRLARALGGSAALTGLVAQRLDEAWAHPDAATATVREVAEIADQSPVTKATLQEGQLPQLPAHAQHVLLCTGRRCMEQGSEETYRVLMRLLAEQGYDQGPQRVKVTRTKCLSPCQAAPVVCTYPSGAFHAQVTAEDAPALMEQVLVGGGTLPGRTFFAGEQ